ncbi:MAG: homoserine kinase [Pseudomonadota bacterium]
MAVFTELSDEAVADLLSSYGLPAPDVVTGIPEGTENTNYKVMSEGKRYILTLFEGRTALADLPYFLGLMEHVASKGLPSAKPVRTTSGDRLTAVAGKPAALIDFLPGRPNMQPTYDDAFAAGALLAQLHTAAQDFAPSRPNGMGLASWRQMAREAGDGLETFGEGVTEEVGVLLHQLKEQWPTDLKRGTIHADLFPDNLLLDHGTPCGVIDFYFACTDYLAYDLAISMNAYMPEAGPVDVTNAEALLSGYQSVRPLSASELDALPILLCGSALRFFLSRAVDHINVQESALYTPKDPLPWLRLLRHHRSSMEIHR